MQLQTEQLKILAAFIAELLAAMKQRSPRPQSLSWLERRATECGLDLSNPPFADGRHLKQKHIAG
jgi:hypothetical protein